MDGLETGAERSVDLLIDLVTSQVVGEQVAAVFVRPIIAVIKHGADVGMAAINRIRPASARAASTVVVPGRGEQIIAEAWIILWWVRDDEWRVIRVRLVP